MTSPLTIVTIASVSPPGAAIPFALLGDATYEPATGGTGGWQIVDRPRQRAATQWYDRSPMQLVLPLMIDSYVLWGVNSGNIEPYCNVLDGWQDAISGTLLPPVLSVTGPVPGIQHQWVLYQPSFKEALRDKTAGYRVQQKVDVTLYEYLPPLSLTGAAASSTLSPAQQAAQLATAQNGSTSYVLYTVGSGDTLQSIAASQLGNWTLWTTIANLNNIRDPNTIVVGQILKIPSQ